MRSIGPAVLFLAVPPQATRAGTGLLTVRDPRVAAAAEGVRIRTEAVLGAPGAHEKAGP